MKRSGHNEFLFAVLFLVAVVAGALVSPPALCRDDEDKGETETEAHKLVMRYSAVVGALPLTFAFGMKAWKWKDWHEFTSEPEGWFGQGTRFGGADKAGHVYGFYLLQRIAHSWFDYTEDGRDTKWIFALATIGAVALAVEIGDGWTAHYGFSWEDLVMDGVGMAFAVLLDLFPALDGLLGMSAEYYPSRGYRANREAIPLDFVSDYTGFKFLVNFKLAGFEYFADDFPRPLRYLMIDLGYYTRGYCEHNEDDKYGYPNRSRYAFVGVSLNAAQMIEELFGGPSSTVGKVTSTPFEYFHLPLGPKHVKKLEH